MIKINQYEYEQRVKNAIGKAAIEFENSTEHIHFEKEANNLSRIRDIPAFIGKANNHTFNASIAITERALYHLLIDLELVEFE
ncbi:hypothetical protein P7E02_12450 [Enterococcus hulanensis]|uniref:hypothetical protein n=1 Tax=Enterococcus hulanensis TaxID=2559929 RepID=UPI00288FDFC1|nr:hypothetical protein [Enterococcus hulanensis]MDT2660685.1 hypothetical protein [Enterococcus hulanensis]